MKYKRLLRTVLNSYFFIILYFNNDYDFKLPTPKTGLQQLVHLCDYIASRKNIEYKFDIEVSVD